jgi:hypothetical protein
MQESKLVKVLVSAQNVLVNFSVFSRFSIFVNL